MPQLLLPPGPHAAFLFDLDGTIADSMPLHYRAWNIAINEQGATFPEDLFYSWGGVPPLQIARMLNERFGYTLDPEAVVTRKEALYRSLIDTPDQLQPVASVLAHIERETGKTPFAIVSGSPRASIVKTLTTLNLLHHFPVIVAAEDYTRGKPDPEPFLTAARLLHVPPAQCLVFEDAEAGIAAAKAAGMQWVHVPTGPVPTGTVPTGPAPTGP